MKKEEKSVRRFIDITEDEKAEIRKKYPEAIVFSTPTTVLEKNEDESLWTEKATFILTPVDRPTSQMIEKYAADQKLTEFQRALIKNVVVDGDMEYCDQDKNYFVYKSMIAKCVDLLGASKGSVAKL